MAWAIHRDDQAKKRVLPKFENFFQRAKSEWGITGGLTLIDSYDAKYIVGVKETTFVDEDWKLLACIFVSFGMYNLKRGWGHYNGTHTKETSL